MRANRSRKGGAVSGPMVGLLLGLVVAIVGVVFLVQGMRAASEEGLRLASEGTPTTALGIEVANPTWGVVLLVLAGILAIGSLVALSGGGGRHYRGSSASSEVTSWTHQPPTGVKSFGNPPPLPSHKAELAAQGIEAFRLGSGEWAVRKAVR